MPALVYLILDLSYVTNNYWQLMVSSIWMSIFSSLLAFVQSRWGKRGNANPKGNTGNVIVDFFHGRELNPFVGSLDLKLQTFRMSMIGLALINVLLVLDDISSKSGSVNLAVVMTAAFQVQLHKDPQFV
jgi:hypothetical protein